MTEPTTQEALHGFSSDFGEFHERPAPYIRQRLLAFLNSASPEQIAAWDLSIPPLQAEVGQVIERDPSATSYSAILEYELPMEQRRPDVLLLLDGGVLVIELKTKGSVDIADIDQVSAYARDLRAYHAACAVEPVIPALVLMGATGRIGNQAGVEIVGPDAVDDVVASISTGGKREALTRTAFLDVDAYRPLPTIVEAARQLMESGSLVRVGRADAATAPTLEYLTAVAHEAAATKTRHLVLLGGLPGTGKTLVGLQLAHSRFLDDLAVARGSAQPTAAAVYLSGNGPLVEVLQYELRSAGGGGKAFVRGVKDYVKKYSSSPTSIPPEHVLIFDEAQRAFDAAQVAAKHSSPAPAKSEPEHFIEFAERIPDWCVVVGLIGAGQEIHVGEEGGIGQWRSAIEASASGSWVVHVPPALSEPFIGLDPVRVSPELFLTAELRFHLANTVHDVVDWLLSDDADRAALLEATRELELLGYPLRVTRDLDVAKAYLRERYQEDPDARFGLVASSRDRDLERFGVPNGYWATDRVRKGPWFGLGDEDVSGQSCRRLTNCVTEFGCQGLELNGVLLAWGSDLILEAGSWSNRLAKRYQNPAQIRDPLQLRRNAYRVMLTRAREGTVVFVPPMPILDETYASLVESGFREL